MIKGIDAKISKIGTEKSCLDIGKEKLTVDSKYLPTGVSNGANLKLYLINPEEGLLPEKKLAKIILEEILNGR